MPQRVLLKSKPWVFIPNNTMLRDDDTLIEEQLRLDYNPVNTNALRSPAVETMAGTNAEEEGLAQEMASLVNGEVFRGKAKPAVEKLGKGKRKRRDDDAVEESSSKRGKKTTEVLDPGAAPSTDAAAPNRAQRGRPQKSKKQASPVERTPNAGPSEEQHRRRSSRVANQGSPVSVKTPPGKLKPRAKRQELQRHMINTYPAVGPAKKDRDVYDDFPGSPESEPAVAKTKTKAVVNVGSPPKKRKRGKRSVEESASSSRPSRTAPAGTNSKTPRSTRNSHSDSGSSSGSKAAPKVKRARTSGRKIKYVPATEVSTTSIEGHSSAILNGRAETGRLPQAEPRRTSRRGESTGNALAITPTGKDTGVNGMVNQRPNQSKQRAGEASRQMRASEREDARARRVEVVESVAVQDSGEREDLVEPGDEGLDQEESSRAQHEDTDSDNDSGDKDEDKDDDEDDEENQQNVDLLGEEKDWAKILNAARSICGPRLLANRTPSLLTTTIKELIQDIKEARNLYKQLLPSAGMDRNQMEGLRAQIYDILTAIEEQIGDEMISETKALTESSEMIQDIYRRAIPALVLLLKDAFEFHARPPKGLHDYETLREVVRLQDMIVALCKKATNWKAKPITHRPIKNPTVRVILPYVRDMRERTFKAQLVKHRRLWKNRQNAIKYVQREQDKLEQSQRPIENSLTSTAPRAGRIKDDIERNRLKWRSSKKERNGANIDVDVDIDDQHSQAPRIKQAHRSTEWSDKEIRVLFRQLEDEYIPDQPAEPRYLEILNAPLLDNKLPERVREQALLWKPFLLEIHGARKPPVPVDWIESIV